MKHVLLFTFAVYLCSSFGFSIGNNPRTPELSDAEDPARVPSLRSLPIQNLLKITDQVYSGGEPCHDGAFAQLAAVGIKTVVSVDGATPDIEQAHKHGLRYVHIPIGYDGISKNARLSFARLVRDAGGPYYIHCHHGRHRGPVAAALVCIAAGYMDQEAALEILERAGTSQDYGGLWRAVMTYRVPPKNAELPELFEVSDTDSLTDAMAQIDRSMDHLEQCRDAGWVSPPDHPDLVPHQQALLLREGFREFSRNQVVDFGVPFGHWIADAENVAQNLESALVANDRQSASREFQTLAQSCSRCHERYRN